MSAVSPEEDLFNKVRPMPAGERAAWLAEACRGDEGLARRIQALLAAYDQGESFLVSPAYERTVTERSLLEQPGTQVGPYKLLEQIGEGGFGMVFMAEQQHPVRRKVALKVLKPGMDTRQVIARFEAERQALALMDHPHIARVLDAGATDSGRPYFVMELVKGVAITEYSDVHRLTPAERLELFVTVCQAVQHAHQKGIIHRDVKPGNVLVTTHDGVPVVKVIDFGVAKALGQQLTDKTLFTGFAQMIGTPLYMSPEQAEFSGLDVDTRADVYSLGVLLYELLTGTTPFDRDRLKSAAFDEIRRIIREDDPPKPSTRLSEMSRLGGSTGVPSVASGAAPARPGGSTSLASVAALRKTDPGRLSQLVRGDLDWIVMKALEKDRNRRYETASAFALDVQRYLADEPVSACPPSTWYRYRKFARRNRGPVAAGSLVLAALLIGMAGATLGLLEAQAERDNVLDAQDKERLALIEAEENFQTARDAVDRMYTRAAEEMANKPQVEQIRRALLEDALKFYRGFLKKKSKDPAVHYETALSQRRVGEIYGFLGDWTESLESHRQATTMLTALSPQFGNEAGYRDELARAHFHSGRALMALLQLEEGTTSLTRAIALWQPLTDEFSGTPGYLEDLARANLVLGRGWTRNYDFPRGAPFVARGQELLARLKQRFPGHAISPGFEFEIRDLAAWRYTHLPHDTATLKQLEQECRDQLAAAEAEAREYPDAPQYENEVVNWLCLLGHVLLAMDRFEELEQLGSRTMAIRQRLATQHPETPEHRKDLAWDHYNTGWLLHLTDRPDQALGHFRTAIAIASDLVARHPENRRVHEHLAAFIRGCPAPQLRDPQRVLQLTLHLQGLGGDPGWDDLAVAQVEAGEFEQALESCRKVAPPAARPTALIAYVTALAYWNLERQAEARELAQQAILQFGSQPNEYWYGFEVRWRVREIARLMGIEYEGLKGSDPEKVLRNGIALYSGLATQRPGDWGVRQELARCCTELWQLLSGADRNEEADQMFDQCVEAWKALVADFPAVPEPRLRLADLMITRGTSLQWMRPDESARMLREGVSIADQLVKEFPDVGAYRRQLILSRTRLAWLLTDTGQYEEAEALGRLAVAVAEKLETDFPTEVDYKGVFAYAARVTGTALVANGRLAEAEGLFARSRDTLEGLALGGKVYSEWDLAMVYRELAGLLAREPDRFREAEHSYHRETALVAKTAAGNPTRAALWEQLGNSHRLWALAVRKVGRTQEAEAALREAIKVLEKTLDDLPGQHPYGMGVLNDTYHNLSELLIATGRLEDVRKLELDRKRKSEIR